jgi:hypothetical protein
VDELADSSGLVHDPQALASRLAADGYLFFRGRFRPSRCWRPDRP